ncbi:pilus assembly protein PilM [Salinivibrio socompensis]|uniref:pilus assembly protein PilM n=2 Tax=Salinivibrio socompensis TaxID=1510206 RepID=UPI000472730B|nr:pilus assembly protein PilM [Salinivibrio socompensis]
MIPSSAVLGIAFGQAESHAIAISPSSSTLTVSGHHILICRNSDTLSTTMKTLKDTLLRPLSWYQRFAPNVVVGVEDDTVISKTLIAADVEDPLEQEVVVGQALSVALNMEISGLFFDFIKQHPLSQQPGQAQYQVVACRQQTLTPLLSALKSVGLKVRVVDTQQHGLQAVYYALIRHHRPDASPLWLHLHAGKLSAMRALPDGELYQHSLTVGMSGVGAGQEAVASSQVLQQHLDHAYHRDGIEHTSPASTLWLSGDWPTDIIRPTQAQSVFIQPGEPFGAPSLSHHACAALGLAIRGTYGR